MACRTVLTRHAESPAVEIFTSVVVVVRRVARPRGRKGEGARSHRAGRKGTKFGAACDARREQGARSCRTGPDGAGPGPHMAKCFLNNAPALPDRTHSGHQTGTNGPNCHPPQRQLSQPVARSVAQRAHHTIGGPWRGVAWRGNGLGRTTLRHAATPRTPTALTR